MQSQEHMQGYSSALHVLLFITPLPVTDVFAAIKANGRKRFALCGFTIICGVPGCDSQDAGVLWKLGPWGQRKWETVRGAVSAKRIKSKEIRIFINIICEIIAQMQEQQWRRGCMFADPDKRFECPTGGPSTGHVVITLCYYQLATEQHFLLEEKEDRKLVLLQVMDDSVWIKKSKRSGVTRILKMFHHWWFSENWHSAHPIVTSACVCFVESWDSFIPLYLIRTVCSKNIWCISPDLPLG